VLAGRLGIARHVVFTGIQQHVADYLQVMDVFCLPSSSRESFGNAATEAMAVGLPVVVFADSPGLAEHVDHDVTGYIAGTQEELEDVLRRLLADPQLRRRLGDSARAAIRERYTLERAAAAYEDLYESALAARRS
jgi:glycosyltransferase involved in cell wall biosynthesis